MSDCNPTRRYPAIKDFLLGVAEGLAMVVLIVLMALCVVM